MIHTRFLLILAFIFFSQFCVAQDLNYIKSNKLACSTLQQIESFYNGLCIKYPNQIKLVNQVAIAPNLLLSAYCINYKATNIPKATLLLNNGIHAGEPDGVDASALLVQDILIGKVRMPAEVQLVVVPVYNVFGYANISQYNRIDQLGPIEKGIRANGNNLDLNRDMMKTDAIETTFLKQLMQIYKPNFFVDSHVSNGADYQHTLTLLVSQHNKMMPALDSFTAKSLVPALYKFCLKDNITLCPYVNHFDKSPDFGWQAFFDGPRFTSGYANLLNTIGLVTETHMLKPYQNRVEATYLFLKNLILFTADNRQAILNAFKAADNELLKLQHVPINWNCDTTLFDNIIFNGYETQLVKSAISDLKITKYDITKPYSKSIKFYDYYTAIDSVNVPNAYIIPVPWQAIIKKIDASGFTNNSNILTTLLHDTTILVEQYKIEKYATVKNPYESHYLHYNTKVKSELVKMQFFKGDIIIYTNNIYKRLLVEALEPQAPDSYFNWNFFDGILQQKEGFSDYVFDNTAKLYLDSNPNLKAEFEKLVNSNTQFANNLGEQLNFIFKHSPYFESAYMTYPIYRLIK
jgi:hypothetical protein